MIQSLGHYRIIEKLGAGGMGEVYRAHDDSLDRDVALKLLPPDRFEDATARARLLREARAAAALNHACISTIYEVGEADGQAYIAMELVDGPALSVLSREKALPFADVHRYGMQIAEALAHAHAHGIVHRDLKCANVLVTADGKVKVLDFGLAKRVGPNLTHATEAETGVSLTEPGQLVGTVAYMAPEQLRGEPADARSDLWALGVVLFELAAGARPFAGKSTYEMSARILHKAPAAFPRSVPVGLRAVIERCLEKEPTRRYQTASEVSAALGAIQSEGAPGALRHAVALRPMRFAAAVALAAAGVAGGFAVQKLRGPAPAEPTRIESLAVLPMANLSGDAGQDYFADGITEVLSTDLARLSGLKRVIGRGSVVQYKGTIKPAETIARELKVDALVTGSVLRAGNRLSITAQLLDPATGNQLWSNRYERDLQDVLAIRNEIVSAIVREIRAKLSPAEKARLASAASVQPEAFEAYLQGHFHWLRQTREDYDLAERYFQTALDKDPGYALAYAGLGAVWMMRGDIGLRPPAEAFPKADALITKALAMDDSSADLHVTLANHRVTLYDWVGAEREYKRALEINPNLADAHFFYSDLLLTHKRPNEWKPEIDRALELDPLNEFDRSYYGWHLNYLGRYDEAIPIFQRLLPTGPNKATNHLGLWGAYYRTQRYDQALAAAKEYFLATGDREFADALGSGAPDAASYRAAMKRSGDVMAARSTQRLVPALRIARMYAHAGDTDSAMHWLEKAFENRESPLARLGVVWDWLDLHGDPRFESLLQRLNLPPSRN
jgi:eukaryotic-like serine/threonine-protein kinase